MPEKTVQPPSSGRHRKPEPATPPDPEQTQRIPELQQLIDRYVDPDGSK
jgi:hypothetical protein